MGLASRKDPVECLHLRMMSWLIKCHLTTQNMESAERTNNTFPVLKHCNFFDRFSQELLTVPEEIAGKDALHLADIWILFFLRDPITERRDLTPERTGSLSACC